MTSKEIASTEDGTQAIEAYLQRVDLQLAIAGLGRNDRDVVCRQIVEQFHDLLACAS